MDASAWPAAAVALLGGAAVMLNLGNRLFGSYRRTARGAAWRIALVVVAAGVFALPLLMLLADLPGADLWAWIAAAVGVAAVMHRWQARTRSLAGTTGPWRHASPSRTCGPSVTMPPADQRRVCAT